VSRAGTVWKKNRLKVIADPEHVDIGEPKVASNTLVTALAPSTSHTWEVKMLSNSDVNRPMRAPTPCATNQVSQQCDLCGWPRVSGSRLAYRLFGSPETLWACHDCQHTLARQVDGEGVLGG